MPTHTYTLYFEKSSHQQQIVINQITWIRSPNQITLKRIGGYGSRCVYGIVHERRAAKRQRYKRPVNSVIGILHGKRSDKCLAAAIKRPSLFPHMAVIVEMKRTWGPELKVTPSPVFVQRDESHVCFAIPFCYSASLWLCREVTFSLCVCVFRGVFLCDMH